MRDRTRWNKDMLPAFQPHFPQQTSFERKKTMYMRIIDYFTASKEWERAIERAKELAQQYDFKDLSKPENASAVFCNYNEVRTLLCRHADDRDWAGRICRQLRLAGETGACDLSSPAYPRPPQFLCVCLGSALHTLTRWPSLQTFFFS